MREFKIRVWDVKNNDWYYTVPGRPDDHNVLDTWYFENLYQDENTYIWEQYTGLRDKNGREIYEGDIVRYKLYADSKLEYVDEVFYRIASGAFMVGDKDNLNTLDCLVDAEVIGNIHENKELLK